MYGEAVEPAGPRAPVGLDPAGHLVELRRAETALARAADLLGDDELGPLEDPDVLADSRERQTERTGELAVRRRSLAELLEDAAARRVRQREEGLVDK